MCSAGGPDNTIYGDRFIPNRSSSGLHINFSLLDDNPGVRHLLFTHSLTHSLRHSYNQPGRDVNVGNVASSNLNSNTNTAADPANPGISYKESLTHSLTHLLLLAGPGESIENNKEGFSTYSMLLRSELLVYLPLTHSLMRFDCETSY